MAQPHCSSIEYPQCFFFFEEIRKYLTYPLPPPTPPYPPPPPHPTHPTQAPYLELCNNVVMCYFKEVSFWFYLGYKD